MTTLIKIGGADGARIPRQIVEAICADGKRFTLESHRDGLLIRPARRVAREGWDEAFAKAKQAGGEDEGFLADALNHDADVADWEW